MGFSCSNLVVEYLCKTIVIIGLFLYLFLMLYPNNQYPECSSFSSFFSPFTNNKLSALPPSKSASKTTLSHLVFGLLGSNKTWHRRKVYIESWWRPNITRGFVYFDKSPSADLLPWSDYSPPYKVSDDLRNFLQESRARIPLMIRMVHGIMEVIRDVEEDDKYEDHFRWLIMGDDDSIFFVDNMVDFLGEYDYNKYYYFGGQSEYVLSNYWFSFEQGFGGGGFILSYPLAKALAKDMDGCLRRYARESSADLITFYCIADIGVNLSPHKGIHQVDLRGDISGFLSSHPKSPLLSLHHFDAVNPIYPNMDRPDSTRRLMKAANADQSRMLQQTICHHRQHSWSFSVAWGYSAHIYEKIMPRSRLIKPLETFLTWTRNTQQPRYMFKTRPWRSKDPCEAPHVFFFQSVETVNGQILTKYLRSQDRGLPACPAGGNHSADYITKIHVLSPATKRTQMDRSECCDIVGVEGDEAEVKFRECMIDEIIA